MFSLRSLLLIVAVAAIGSAALVYRTPLWASAIVTLTLGFFAFGLMRIYSHPEKRSLWIPVCIVGWLYLASAFIAPLELYNRLVTSRLVFALWGPEDRPFAVASVVTDTYWLVSAFIGVALLLLLWGLVESQRAFWRAFAIIGIGYIVLTESGYFRDIENSFPTAKLIAWSVYGELADPNQRDPFGVIPEIQTAKVVAWDCAFALLFGSIGGLLYEWRTQRDNMQKNVAATIDR